eukprot:5376091-Pyramimonas_sp.AAC.1
MYGCRTSDICTSFYSHHGPYWSSDPLPPILSASNRAGWGTSGEQLEVRAKPVLVRIPSRSDQMLWCYAVTASRRNETRPVASVP